MPGTKRTLTGDGPIVVVHGFACRIRVERGHLHVEDGVADDGRIRTFHRATSRIRRLVILGHNGTISLEAIRWLRDVGAAYLQIDRDGTVLAAFGPCGTDRPGLRRAQARAFDTPLGNDIARRLIAEKVAGQAETLAGASSDAHVSDATLKVMREASTRLHVAATRDDIRLAEAMAAGAYWSALTTVPVRFARQDASRIPAHWLTLGGRTSPLTGGPRLAGNPANALLNYLYALLEGEATFAARIVGLDPGLGILHADQLNRDSLSADLMEPVRPLVDRYVLRLLAERSFAASDFYETRQGVCRVTPPLARELALTAPDWGRAVGRVAEEVARLLDAAGGHGRSLATPLSGRNRSAGRGKGSRTGDQGAARVDVGRRCTECGVGVIGDRLTCGDRCRAAARDAQAKVTFYGAGARRLRALRAEGVEPVTADVKGRIGARQRERQRQENEWNATHPERLDSAMFRREVLPAIQGVALRELARRTGLSATYCGRIREGKNVPHERWWDVLRGVTFTDAVR